MVDFCKSDKMRKINGKMAKPSTDNGVSNDISSKNNFFIMKRVFLKFSN